MSIESLPFSSSHLLPVSKSPVVLPVGAVSRAVVASPPAVTLLDAEIYTSLLVAGSVRTINAYAAKASAAAPLRSKSAEAIVSLFVTAASRAANSTAALPPSSVSSMVYPLGIVVFQGSWSEPARTSSFPPASVEPALNDGTVIPDTSVSSSAEPTALLIGVVGSYSPDGTTITAAAHLVLTLESFAISPPA